MKYPEPRNKQHSTSLREAFKQALENSNARTKITGKVHRTLTTTSGIVNEPSPTKKPTPTRKESK